MSNFIADFLNYNSGTECHKSYLRWAAISALGAAAGPRYRLRAGSYHIYPIMYILYVGPQGNRKSYAKNKAKDLIQEAFPEYPIGADITTRDDIIKFLSGDLTERAYTTPDGALDTYHPLALFINEFKDFTSYNPSMMINFVVDIYDYVDRVFRCSTIRRGAENITHPYLSILACENTEWFLLRLKEGVVTGGFSRRFIVLYEYQKPPEPIPIVELPKDHEILWKRMVMHLQNMHTTSREFTWHADGMKLYREWYVKNFNEMQDETNVAGFQGTLDQQLLKLVMLLDLANSSPGYIITAELIEEGLTWLTALWPNLVRLYSSGGRNELAMQHSKVLELIDSRGGIIAEKEFLRLTGKDMNMREQQETIKHLVDSDQLLRQAFKYPENKAMKTWLITAKGMAQPDIRKAYNSLMKP